MKQYEALFIFHNPTEEDGIKQAIDNISEDISKVGGKVETVQKMDRKSFTRITDKSVTSGFYANVIFQAPQSTLDELQHQLRSRNEVHRVVVSLAVKNAGQIPMSPVSSEAGAA